MKVNWWISPKSISHFFKFSGDEEIVTDGGCTVVEECMIEQPSSSEIVVTLYFWREIKLKASKSSLEVDWTISPKKS